jgi:ABC-type transporter MlaC component
MNPKNLHSVLNSGTLRRRFAYLAIVAVVSGAITVAAHAPGGSDPTSVTKTLVTRALAILGSNIPLRQKQEQLRVVVKQSFDFTEMSRSVLGTHWNNLT